MTLKKTDPKNEQEPGRDLNWEAVFQLLDAPALLLSPDFKILFANRAALQLAGGDEKQFLGRSCYEIFHGSRSCLPNCPLARLMGSGKAETVSEEVEMFGGIYRTTCTPVLDENGKIQRIIHLAHDISDYKQTLATLHESEQRYRSLFDGMLDGVYRSTHEGRFVEVNPAMVRMFGYASREEMLQVEIKKELYFAPEERGSHILDTGQRETEIYRMRRKDGSEIWVEDHGSYVHDAQGGVLFHEGLLRDVTERVYIEMALRTAEAKYRSIFENATVCIYQSTPEGRFLSVNPYMARLLGYASPEEMIASITNIEEQFYSAPALRAEFQRLVQAGEVHGFVCQVRHKAGGLLWVQIDSRAVSADDGHVEHYEGFITDITDRQSKADELHRAKEALEEANRELHQALEREQQLARTDGLTGLFNRSFFFELASREFSAAVRYQSPLSILMFDIDDFKQVNDTFGHVAGDKALARVAQAAVSQVRYSDILARYGGDEFVLLLPHTKLRQAFSIAERIREAVAALRVETPKGLIAVTVSIGVAETKYTLPHESLENLTHRADEVLYTAKQAGRNRTFVFGQD
jgi:diguanylate cyclase (GGDEF)-like protein/PAS domain S-box-containing protein